MASCCFSSPSSALSSSPIPKISIKRKQWKSIKALKEWREYEDAVREKDLARALRFLKSMEALQIQSSPPSPSPSPSLTPPSSVSSVPYSPGFSGTERDWEAGTQFWDEKLANELAEGRLSGTAFDRYCMVLFAGIAAEALVYGEAEGGENDENLFRNICLLLQPPLSIAEMSNQARWSVLQSYNLLKWHKDAHRAAVKALERGHGLSIVIRRIEEAMLSSS
ncbi:hypothetical protein J5N97_017821 [Dioscorea zingiberensis]|uniref:Uncharacterized protein n=1 Tax=Dioscorea zingiberensis TaxID=325984 RepID=A0A9D5HGK2_9LILI|nr:hypothetical protein J5N97_017821 [Dioscorea zingiberensis]